MTGGWEVKPYTATVFKGQAALSCFEVWAGERRIASTINEANAHLIAAAPDCHKELNGIINAFEELGWSAFMAYMSKHKEDSIKALTKAEGK